MVTYRMIGVADEYGRTYECKYGTYNKKDGFVFTNPPTEECQWTALINALFHEDIWKLKKEPIKKITLEEIEKKLGCKIVIIDSDETIKGDIANFLNWLETQIGD